MKDQLLDKGFCIIPDVIGRSEIDQVNEALNRAVEEAKRRGVATYTDFLDPNDKNVRLYTLPDYDPIFVELLRHPVALEYVRKLLGENFIVSSFTANIAYPGAGSMNLHSDQSLVVPPPWIDPWAMNIIWCLDDVHDTNGATRYVPGSHRYRTFDDVPPDAMASSKAFEASTGSIIVLDGRMWHTSGKNVTTDERRALLFAYYAMDFIRPQTNHDAALSPATKATLDESARVLLGMGAAANVRIGGDIIKIDPNMTVDTDKTLGKTG